MQLSYVSATILLRAFSLSLRANRLGRSLAMVSAVFLSAAHDCLSPSLAHLLHPSRRCRATLRAARAFRLVFLAPILAASTSFKKRRPFCPVNLPSVFPSASSPAASKLQSGAS